MNYLDKITEMYAYVSVDESGEGVVGMTLPVNGRETFMPFVGAEKDKMESLKPIVIQISKGSNKTIKLIKMDNRKDIEIFEP